MIESGDVGDSYHYRVRYADADGDAPAYVQVHIRQGGADISGSPFAIDCAGADYAKGVTCSYTQDGLDGQRACAQRIHVTGGTNGILVDSLERHRPFTPSFMGRAEDQAYILSVLMNPGTKLAYVHKDGLIMRHDKEVFAQEAIESAFVGKLIGDYVRIIYFSAYAGALTDNVTALKEMIDPFTGCFVSLIPATVVYLRFCFKAASFFAMGENALTVQFIRNGAERIKRAMDFVSGEKNMLKRVYEKERLGWNMFYDTISAVEDAIRNKDEFALDLQKKAEIIVEECAIAS